MRFYGYEDKYLGGAKDGEALPEKSIRAIVIETPKEEQALREFLNKHLSNNGSNALAINPDATNGDLPLGNDSSKVKLSELLTNSALDTKLEAINALSAVVNMDGHFDAKYAAAEKLSLLIQEL